VVRLVDYQQIGGWQLQQIGPDRPGVERRNARHLYRLTGPRREMRRENSMVKANSMQLAGRLADQFAPMRKHQGATAAADGAAHQLSNHDRLAGAGRRNQQDPPLGVGDRGLGVVDGLGLERP
jgi:hypothetical protein